MLLFSTQGMEKFPIPESHGPFENCIPVIVNQAIFMFNTEHSNEFLSIQTSNNKSQYNFSAKLKMNPFFHVSSWASIHLFIKRWKR